MNQKKRKRRTAIQFSIPNHVSLNRWAVQLQREGFRSYNIKTGNDAIRRAKRLPRPTLICYRFISTEVNLATA